MVEPVLHSPVNAPSGDAEQAVARYRSRAMETVEISSRAWSGPEDLRAIEELISAAWNGPSRPRINATVGDLEWWIGSLGRDADLAEQIQLWFLHGSVAGGPG